MVVAHRIVDIYAALGVTLAVAAVSLFLRLYARRVTSVRLWWDDWFAVVAWVFALGWNAVVVTWVFFGLGQRVEDIHHVAKEDQPFYGYLLLYVAEIVYGFSLGFSKFAILAFYWRMFRTSCIRWPIRVLFACSAAWLVIRTLVAVFHCWPIQAFWDFTVDDRVCPVNDSKFFFWSVLAHLLIDLAILALPVFQVGRLQLAPGQKIAVTGLFMFGSLVCVASVVVLVESRQYDPFSDQMPYDIAGIILWATVEVNLAIVSSSLPMLRPIFNKILPGSLLGSFGRSRSTTQPDMATVAGTTGKLSGVMASVRRQGQHHCHHLKSHDGSADDASSTCNLTGSSVGKVPSLDSASASSSFSETVVEAGSRTMISCPGGGVDGVNEALEAMEVLEALERRKIRGIVVKSEMRVQYSDRVQHSDRGQNLGRVQCSDRV